MNPYREEEKIPLQASRIEYLKRQINDNEYLSAAISRIAYVLSNEILDLSEGGNTHAWTEQSGQAGERMAKPRRKHVGKTAKH